MLRFILWVSALVQTFLSTSLELIGNENGFVAGDDPNPPADPTPPVVEPNEPPKAEPPQEPTKSKNDYLRELSKEYGVNLFDANGLKAFKEFTDNQKSDLDKANELIDSQTNVITDLKSKLKASELGIAPDQLEDALKLAGGDADNLAKVIEKYPMFKSKTGVKIGITGNNKDNPKGLSEAEKYMANNPRLYKKPQ